VTDLDLLVDAALGVTRPAFAADDQSPAAHLEADLVGVDPGKVGLDHRLGRISVVVDVHPWAERTPARGESRAAPDVTEQLVDLTAHAVEIREWIAGRRHLGKVSGSPAADCGPLRFVYLAA